MDLVTLSLETYFVLLIIGHIIGVFSFIFSDDVPYMIDLLDAHYIIRKWLMIVFAPICYVICRVALWQSGKNFIARK